MGKQINFSCFFNQTQKGSNEVDFLSDKKTKATIEFTDIFVLVCLLWNVFSARSLSFRRNITGSLPVLSLAFQPYVCLMSHSPLYWIWHQFYKIISLENSLILTVDKVFLWGRKKHTQKKTWELGVRDFRKPVSYDTCLQPQSFLLMWFL